MVPSLPTESGGCATVRLGGTVHDVAMGTSTRARTEAAAARAERVGSTEADIAHDLNNLMVTVTGYTALALDELGDTHPASADLHQVANAAERAGLLTQQLLALHRPPDDDADDTQGHVMTTTTTRSATILVAEDDPAIRELVRRSLEAADHRVVAVADGQAALEAAAALPHLDAFVTDIDMPRLDGLAAARTLAAAHPTLAVVFVTGRDIAAGQGSTGLPATARTAWLAKPFATDELLSALAGVLAAR
jgi:CheY-like chemotaxis protein